MTANPSTLIISAEAGSLFDKVGRVACEGLERAAGHPVAFENAGNSSGVGGAEAGAKAPADGSTILICNKGAITSHPHTAKGYSLADFAPLCQVAEAPIAVAVGRDSPFNSLSDLIKAARTNPGTISYSTPNPYHTQRLAMSAFETANDILFKFMVLGGGNSAAIEHLNDGTVDFAFLAAHNLVKPSKTGAIKILGVAHGERLPFLPDVPTFKEQGYDLVTAIWLGLFAPAGVSAEGLQQLQTLAETAANDTATKSEIADLEMVPAFLPGATFREKVAADSEFHRGVLKGLGAL